MTSPTLFTLGYQQRSLDEFVRLLLQAVAEPDRARSSTSAPTRAAASSAPGHLRK